MSDKERMLINAHLSPSAVQVDVIVNKEMLQNIARQIQEMLEERATKLVFNWSSPTGEVSRVSIQTLPPATTSTDTPGVVAAKPSGAVN